LNPNININDNTTAAVTGGWRGLWATLRRRKATRWSVYTLFFLLFIAVTADFLANEKPLYCKIAGEKHFPVLKDYAVALNLAKWDAKYIRTEWSEHDYEVLWMPLIPYSPTTMDRKNARFKSPFAEQNIPSLRYRHWLGTDKLGRDVMAGMIYGTRIAMLVGILSMLVAGFIGLLMGSMAGYFGNEKLKVSILKIVLLIPGLILGIFYGFIARRYVISEGSFGWEVSKGLLIFLGVVLIFYLLGMLLKKLSRGSQSMAFSDRVHHNPEESHSAQTILRSPSRLSFLKKKITLPVDSMVMRTIEVFNSIPGLFILLAVLSIVESKSVLNIIFIIGFLGWTTTARFVRAAFLRVRNMPYVEAAQSLGFSSWRVIWQHALPNAMTPVYITIAFGMAGAILAEATLSFLGIGVAFDAFTWGKMLSIARSNFSAWWMVVFPGIGIFVTVTVFNLIGDGLRR